MVLTLKEKEKLLEKSTKIYEEIENIKIRKSINIKISPKYYDKDSRYAICGFNLYINGSMSLFNKDINRALEDLENNIEYHKDNTKSYCAISDYDINALLDFIYNGNYLIEKVKEINNSQRRELEDLLG